MKQLLLMGGILLSLPGLRAQEIVLTERAPLEAVYGEVWESDDVLPMNELGIESGYLLYETEVELPEGGAELALEQVRDYAAVYLDRHFAGTLTDARKSLSVAAPAGSHLLQLYVENIGRITYGPEILDNAKGLFGSVRLGGEEIVGWRIIPLAIREGDPAELDYVPMGAGPLEPCFRRGCFDCAETSGRYLDVSGWGMGEVWLNGCYLGAFWNEEKQQSIRIPDDLLRRTGNMLVVFDIRNCDPTTCMHLSTNPVFK